jgi:hypothetical protein
MYIYKFTEDTTNPKNYTYKMLIPNYNYYLIVSNVIMYRVLNLFTSIKIFVVYFIFLN